MSLISAALRIIIRKAMLNKTWADERVFDQPLDPIDLLLKDAEDDWGRPIVTIYTQNTKGSPESKETQGGPQEISTKVFCYMPPSRIEIDGHGADRESVDNQSSGLVLNFIGRQVDGALHYGNEPWLSLWRKFVLYVEDVKTQFVLIELENGLRVPCLEIDYTHHTVAEPEYGTPIYGYWQDFDSAMREDGPEMTKIADMFKAMIENPNGLPSHELLQMNHGLTDTAIESTGLAPVTGSADQGQEAPLLSDDDPGDNTDIDVVEPPRIP